MVKTSRKNQPSLPTPNPLHIGMVSGLLLAKKIKHKGKKINRLTGKKGGGWLKKALAVLAGPIGWYHLAKNAKAKKEAKKQLKAQQAALAEASENPEFMTGNGMIGAKKKRTTTTRGRKKKSEELDDSFFLDREKEEYDDDDDDDDDDEGRGIMSSGNNTPGLSDDEDFADFLASQT